MKKLFIVFFGLFLILSVYSNNSYSEPRKLLLEYCTGTWCGWCPCGHQALTTIQSQYPLTIALAYHGASSDPWQVFNGNQIRALLGFNAYPTAIIDRTNTPSNPYVTYDMWMGRVQERYNSTPNTRVSLAVASKNYNSSTNELSFTINSTALENLTGQYKISFVLVEDNLVYQQNHYAACGTTGYVNDYIHKHVVRSMLNNYIGENLNTGNWNSNEVISKSLSTTLDASWVAANCRIVAFVFGDNASPALSIVEQAIEESVMGPTGISGNDPEALNSYTLSQNYPNPFNPTTSVKFTIPKDGKVTFKVFDILGNEVASYIDGFLQNGTYNVQIDGSNLSSGVYFYELKTQDFVDTKRMVLVK